MSLHQKNITQLKKKNAFLLPFFYKNNSSLTTEENKEIKTLLLNFIKEKHSNIYEIDKKNIYNQELFIYFFDDNSDNKSFWVDFDDKFMDTVEKKSDNEYTAIIQMKTPEDWRYYIDIINVDGKYLISDCKTDA